MIRTEYDQLFIGGAWEVAAGSERIPVCSPHTGRQFGSVPLAVTAEVMSVLKIDQLLRRVEGFLARVFFDHAFHRCEWRAKFGFA